MKLSENFTLDECTYSEIAEKYDIENYPDTEQIENIRALIIEILQPIRDEFKCPIYLNSVFRSEELNKKVGGAKSSHHLAINGVAAADFYVRAVPMRKVFEWIKENLEFDQLIDEKNLKWIHVSFRRIGKNRKQILKIK